MLDFCIIGAGVVGGMIARELSRYECSIAIVERMNDVAMGATRANSAIVHAGFDAKEGSLKARLNVRGSLLMEKICQELGVKYKNNGSLVVGFSEEDKKTLEELRVRGEKNGVPDLRVLSRPEILALEENIGEGVTCALHAPTGAIVCPYELCLSAVGSAMDNGAELLLNFEVCALTKERGGYTVIAKDGRRLFARYIINCAGVFADEISALAGYPTYSVHARRGEYMLLDRECGELITHTVFRCPSKMGKGILVSPTVDGNLLLGPTAEDIEDKEDTSTTSTGLDAVRRQAGEQVKGIPFQKIITSFTGLRSVGSTGDFVIRFEDDAFLNVGAIESPGLSASPAIAEYVSELLSARGELTVRKETFVATRTPLHAFREMSIDEKNELIAKDPSFAHIVCRCELVTEGEIRHAIRQNPRPRDVDGVKRRTRASMGRCQGGFCTPYIIELLAEELSIDYGEVTKFGGASRINVAKTKEG